MTVSYLQFPVQSAFQLVPAVTELSVSSCAFELWFTTLTLKLLKLERLRWTSIRYMRDQESLSYCLHMHTCTHACTHASILIALLEPLKLLVVNLMLLLNIGAMICF